MHYCPEKSWYVLRVRAQAERLVHVGLHHKQFEVLNPTYQALSIRRDHRKVLTRAILMDTSSFVPYSIRPIRL